MARRKSELIGPMSLQPVRAPLDAGCAIACRRAFAVDPRASTSDWSATQDAVQAAKAKISRRNSLKKQRQLLKGKGGVSAFDMY